MTMTNDELRALPAMVPIKLAAQALDIEYKRARRLAGDGAFPVRAQRLGSNRWYVLKTDLLRFLEITED